MLDKSISYAEIIMKRKKGKPLPDCPLTAPFRFVLFKDGDEADWAEIETSVGEFDKAADALTYFQKRFLCYREELVRRCIFIENAAGEKIATCNAWWEYTGERRDPWLHWIAVKPGYQGQGLGKAVTAEGIRRMIAIEGDRDMYLSTQTWSYKAVNIYRKLGFAFTREKGLGGHEKNEYDKAMKILKPYLR
jgi:ribosomal protein S18 acetylase RimI-like enzyme